jgi:hypothetical protein
MKEPPGASAFADSLAQLEAQIAAADARGESIPPEARQMAEKLRELVNALGDLTSTLTPSVQITDDPESDAS